MPRKRILDEKKKNEIIAILTVGCTRYTAARYIGCHPSEIRREIGRTKEFAKQVARAEEAAEVHYLQRIKAASQKEQYWRAAAWVLERRNPNRYASRGAHTVTFDQLARLMTQIGEIVGGEIKDVETRINILKRFQHLTGTLIETNGKTEPERPREEPEYET
jgi:hypothetical protein